MKIISDGKIQNLFMNMPTVEPVKVKNEWEYYVQKFQERINANLRSSNRKEWSLAQISKRLRFARIKDHHIREFFEECEDKGYDKNRYNFYVHFFSKTKIIWKTTKPLSGVIVA